MIAANHRRELQQRAEVVRPQLPEGRMHARGCREVARVILGVAVERPREAIHAARGRRRGFWHEAGVRVVDAAGAMALVQIGAQRGAGEEQDDERRQAQAEAF